MAPQSVAISFTGGKDSLLALHRVVEQGYKVAVLVTFAPPDKPFRAHPMAIIKAQSQALNIPHVICTITGPHYLESYREKLQQLKEEYGIHGLVTGDILQVCSDFMERACKDIVTLIRPLWQLSRQELLQDMWQRPFEIMVTCINRRKLSTSDENNGVGDILSLEWIKKHVDINNADICGEYGEFHSAVLDAPLYINGKINVDGYQKEEGDYIFYHVLSAEIVSR
ncbi:uncharacterized protein BX664DRAFT_339867 [Halteromyces radiatus]|uniref:uncharacterized protein n=1 Tax=Halteromyces radiatus TaxID=101107 RepID=UPI00221E94CF|nr:uncharacterized protein BX664DRAFT_339867 [Halteromyces radiatus]KAI8083124.1 hypothetical protein BX664DRAFT_339867 [Halteromyces radiatus]